MSTLRTNTKKVFTEDLNPVDKNKLAELKTRASNESPQVLQNKILRDARIALLIVVIFLVLVVLWIIISYITSTTSVAFTNDTAPSTSFTNSTRTLNFVNITFTTAVLVYGAFALGYGYVLSRKFFIRAGLINQNFNNSYIQKYANYDNSNTDTNYYDENAEIQK